MLIKCGHCGGRHLNVAAVRSCFGQPVARSVTVARPGPATVGMYRKRGQIYRVDWTSHGHLFAKVATIHTATDGQVAVSYSPAKGMVARLSQADRMDSEEVAEFGRLTTTCLRCGRRLEQEDSVQAGIGPWCRRYV